MHGSKVSKDLLKVSNVCQWHIVYRPPNNACSSCRSSMHDACRLILYMSVHAASCRYAYPSNSILLTACSLSLGELGGGACSDLGFEQDPGYTWCAEMVTSGLTQLCCISRSTLIPTSPDTCRPGRSTRRNHSVPVPTTWSAGPRRATPSRVRRLHPSHEDVAVARKKESVRCRRRACPP